MADSDSDSALSSAPPTEDEMPIDTAPAKAAKPAPKKKKKNGTILTFFNKKSPSPPPRQRPASPPHEYVPEDNPDIAVRVRRVNRVPSRQNRVLCMGGRYVSTLLIFGQFSL
jgi:hypothetical protein